MGQDRKIVFVTDAGGDWTCLYVDGELKAENHSLDWREVLEVLGIPHERREIDFLEQDLGRGLPQLEDMP